MMIDYVSIINDTLSQYIIKAYPEIIYDAMLYSVTAGGKRMRPRLMIHTAEGFGGSMDRVMPFACALEFIHTYSLIHDDLPCMDDDDLRRGVPTNHKVYGEAMALLAGDALLNSAYEIMAGECFNNCIPETVSAMYEIASSAGVNGMIGGQVVDIISEDKIIDESTLLYIHKNKTAAIITAAFAAGAILSGADKRSVKALKEAAGYFGTAFQIKDDILDVKSTTEVLGKPVGSDAKNAKITYVSMFGIEKAEKDFAELSQKSLDIIKSLALKTDSLEKYMSELMYRTF